MSADFSTTLNVSGNKEDCLQILIALHQYCDNQRRKSVENGEGWYLESSLTSSPETAIDELYHDGEMKLSYGGPYGSFSDLFFNQFDLFERIADAAPRSRFQGEISGWDNGGETKVTAELSDGLLKIRQVFQPDGEPADHEVVQTRRYDPEGHVYLSAPTGKSSVSLTFSVFDNNGAKKSITLTDDDVFCGLTLYCFPENLLAVKGVESLFKLLASSLWTTYPGTETDEYKQQITDFGRQIEQEAPGFTVSRLEISRIISCDESFLFDWLRSDEYPEIDKLSKAVCAGTKQTKQKKAAELQKYLETEEFAFPAADEYPGWPELCRHQCEKTENGFRLIRDPNRRLGGKLNWRGIADSLVAFAEYICSEEDPAEYAVESVIIDYSSGTARLGALYMPGGPEVKPSQSNVAPKQESEKSKEAPAKMESCAGLTFAYAGKMKIFKNKQSFVYYVEKNGGKATETVSKKADYFVTNEKSSEKSWKAKQMGIPVLSEAAFAKRFGSP